METGKGKIQQICNLIKKETIEPAQQQASEIIENAHLQASKIIEEAESQIKEAHKKTAEEIQAKQKAFQSSLELAAKQAVSELRQKIEKELFDRKLMEEVSKKTQDPSLIANIIQGLLQVLKQEGLDKDLELFLPKIVDKKAVSQFMAEKALQDLVEKAVSLEGLKGGVQIKLKDQQLTLDMGEKALKDLLAEYSRKEFRSLFFT